MIVDFDETDTVEESRSPDQPLEYLGHLGANLVLIVKPLLPILHFAAKTRASIEPEVSSLSSVPVERVAS